MSKQAKLVRNAERALEERKRSADDAPLLGVDITTPSRFLVEAWELFGDECRLVQSSERTLLILEQLRSCAQEQPFPLRPTLGTAKLLGSFVERFAGTPAFDEALVAVASGSPQAVEGWPAGEAATLKVLAEYLSTCHSGKLIEGGSAARTLAEAAVPLDAEAEERLFCGPAVQEWLATLGAASPEMPQGFSLAEDVSVRFVFLAGSTVIVRAVKEEVDVAIAAGAQRVVVFAPRPRGLYEALAPSLGQAGVDAACKDSIPFSGTWLGRTLHAVRHVLTAEGSWKMAATDFAYSPLSGMSTRSAEELNAQLRGDILLTCSQGEELLRQASPTFEAFKRVAEDPTSDSVWALRTVLDERDVVPAMDRLVEQAAMDRLSNGVEAAEGLDCIGSLFTFLEGAFVPFAQRTGAAEEPLVEFLPMNAMDSVAPSSADQVIFADMTKDAFPVPLAKPATVSILHRLGIEDDRSAHEELRVAFATAERAARRGVSCVVPLRNFAGGQNYPSFIYDEFVEAIAGGNVVSVDVDGLFDVPAGEQVAWRMLDEVDVVQGFGQTFEAPTRIVQLAPRKQGVLRELSMSDFMKKSQVKPGLPVLSASQLELYSQCPYQWFIARKVGVQSIDEVFDNLHQGTFAHEVFRQTFDALAQQGVRRVTPENVDDVRAVAANAFEALFQEQSALAPGERCVPAHLQDEMRMDEMKRQILEAFSFMALMPADFEIHAGEFKLDPEDGIEYAGAVINGSVDRIDVSDGQFAVLDYKGSVGGHEAGASESLDELPEKIQALIYAQSLGRTPEYAGMACVGAMYLGYRAREASDFSAGSYGNKHYDMKSLTKNGKSLVTMDFSEFLTRVEEMLSVSVERMLAGDIMPQPRPGACTYCAMTFCTARMAG